MIINMTTLNTTDKKPVAYGYARVSTKRQESEGYSLEAQQEQIKRFCADRYDLKGIYTEAESGKKSDRPKLQEALRLCSLSEGTLVIAKIDRLTRDLHFLTKLQREGIKFIAYSIESLKVDKITDRLSEVEEEIVLLKSLYKDESNKVKRAVEKRELIKNLKLNMFLVEK